MAEKTIREGELLELKLTELPVEQNSFLNGICR